VQIHEAKKAGHNGNISKIVKLEFGEVEAGLRADVVVEGEYFFEGTTHTPIEPHCAIGLWEEGGAPAGRLTVWSSTQVPHYLHRELARCWSSTRPRCASSSPRSAAASAARASRSTSSSASRSWR
jgi:CO/xanthine dehydrogenase Mo-binding subunit